MGAFFPFSFLFICIISLRYALGYALSFFMSRTANISLHVKVAFLEIKMRKPNLFSRMVRHAQGIARALAPSYTAQA